MNKFISYLFVSFLAIHCLYAQTYNSSETSKLKEFLNRASVENGILNGQQLNALYDDNDPSTWSGITWNSSTPKQVEEISWEDKKLNGYLDLSDFELLTKIKCNSNQLDSINTSNCANLTLLECFTNQITYLNVGNCSSLNILGCQSNLIDSLNISLCNNLTFLGCDDNNLNYIDLTDAVNLENLGCMNNNLTEIDLSSNTNLTTFHCVGNQLTSLDLSLCPKLEFIECSINPITSLSTTNCSLLEFLHSGETELTALDVSTNTKLKELYCSVNMLTTLDVTMLDSLTTLICSKNQLKTLDVSNNLKLKELTCAQNQIDSLNLTVNTALVKLVCYENNLHYLNAFTASEIEDFYCTNNNLTFSTLILPENMPDTIDSEYAPQNDIIIGIKNNDIYEHNQEDTLDLSSEYLDGATTYTWKYATDGLEAGEFITDYDNGKFQIGKYLIGSEIYCELSNENYPEFSDKNVLKTVSVLITGIPSEVDAPESDKSVLVYPVPAEDHIYMENLKLNTTLKIWSENGSLVLIEKVVNESCNINIKDLPSGVYFLEISDGSIHKFIKK